VCVGGEGGRGGSHAKSQGGGFPDIHALTFEDSQGGGRSAEEAEEAAPMCLSRQQRPPGRVGRVGAGGRAWGLGFGPVLLISF
jgi:hypothetical protein